MLLALDPGMNSPGAALFDNQRVLFRAGRVPIPGQLAECPSGRRRLLVAHKIVRWLCSESGINHVDDRLITEVIYEDPQFYTRDKAKGDPNKLAGVLGVACNVTGILSTRNSIAVFSPTPAEWIGQLSKVCPVCKGKAKKKCKECRGSAWETPRGRFIRRRLSDDELALVPDQNDAIDAVGLGLWALGRLEKHTVFSNGRDGR